MVATWVFEPESEAVGMRNGAFEGPLVSEERGSCVERVGLCEQLEAIARISSAYTYLGRLTR